MYVIVVYDIEVKRVQKVSKCLRKWLNWVQNSVFEGEVTPATLRQIKGELAQIINPLEDSVLFLPNPRRHQMATRRDGHRKTQHEQLPLR